MEKVNSSTILNKIRVLEHKIRLLQCCINASGGSGGTTIIGGMTFYHDVVEDSDSTYQDNRLIGAQDIWFVLDNVPFHQSDYTFSSVTGTITLSTGTFGAGNEIIVNYIAAVEEDLYSDEYSDEYS